MVQDTAYQPLVLVDTAQLTRPEWLEYRRKGLGGSDAAAVLGISPFRTARDLYYDKLGVVTADDQENWVASFKYFAFSSARTISVWLRGSGEGQFMVGSTIIDEPAAALFSVQPTEEWTQYTAPFAVPNGITQLCFSFNGKGAVDFLKFEFA